ncbi:hypothetical protein HWV62_27017 [Athelia sp. TMB]|nr:hypothetical protein HWV62_27017 [Athelia sp. TMB]
MTCCMHSFAWEDLCVSSTTQEAPPPQSLPTETLELIFDLTVASSRRDLNPNNAPLVLRKVSRRWRAIADGRKNLWSHLTIQPSQFHQANAAVASQWLKRAGATTMLQITLVAHGIHRRHIRRVLDAILHTSIQWECLYLDVPASSAKYVLNNPAVAFPALKQLRLEIDGHVVLKPHAPLLDAVRLLIRPPTWQPMTIMNLGWASITYLDIDIASGTLDYIWHVMYLCPHLDTLRVTAFINCMLPQRPVLLHHHIYSNIRKLRLVCDLRPSVVAHFLYGLTLPRLNYLELICFDDSPESFEWPMKAITDLRQRCLPPLVSLVTVGKRIFEADIIALVRNLKYLEEIAVVHENQDLVTDAVRALLPRDNAALEKQHAAYYQERAMAGLP